MEKSRDAFRTISEVADWLDVPTHVLRFWESRFAQIKPVKRAGGRRYYRPSDMRIIGGVKTLLHDQGMTIRGVQKLFREQGVKHVSSHSPSLYDASGETFETVDVLSDEPGAAVETVEVDVLQPAAVARTTRDATPAPVATAEPAGSAAGHRQEREPDTTDAVQPDMFATDDPALRDEAPIDLVEEDVAPTPVEAEQSAAFAMLDVPARDPADDDAGFEVDTGPAARLAMARHKALLASAELLRAAALRLHDLKDRME